MSKNEYNGLILTNHTLKRMKERGITNNQIWETYSKPDRQDEINNATRRIKKFNDRSVTIVFKNNQKHETIIISTWMEPPLPGSRDYKAKEWWEKYKKSNFLGKFWLTLIKQVNGY